jgi:trimethylamine:corrinoid methyltransferase-like protein
MALDAIKEVGLSGDFLSAPHTLENYRKVLSRPLLATRCHRTKWEARGGKVYEEAVRERVRSILDAEPRVYLDAVQEKELARIEELAMATTV